MYLETLVNPSGETYLLPVDKDWKLPAEPEQGALRCLSDAKGEKAMPETSVIRPCPVCGAKNRIPRNRLQDRPVCGKCRAPLNGGGAYDRPVEVTDRTFQREVMDWSGSVLVDCWAPWCGPCRTVAPILDQLASAYAGRVKIAKLNVDENPGTASQYGIQSIPTMLLFKGGRLLDKVIGALPKAEIERRLQSLL
jgi:thioredoxin 2